VRQGGTLVAGPWLSEVGFEVLYWLPFLAWVAERHDVAPERLIAISRGGAGVWYKGLAGTYADVFERWTPDDLKRAQHERATSATRSQKQLAPTPGERELLRELLADRGVDPDAATLIHPSAVYLGFKGFWDGWRGIDTVRRRTRNLVLPSPPTDAAFGLPSDYVAVKIYFSDCFPDTAANRASAARVVQELAAEVDVVLLATGLDLDDHAELSESGASRVRDLSSAMLPETNLAVQTSIIAGARGFVGTYGGFSYLAPFLGVPSLSFYTEENFVPGHLEVMRRALIDLQRSRPAADFTARRLEGLDIRTAASRWAVVG